MNTILVVDDMAIFRDPIAASLRLAGYETRCAADGEEALRVARAHRPDLILLDASMPKMDGLTFLKHLRADPALAGTRVILLTALSESKYVLAAASLGVRDYLLKSRFRLADLLARIKAYEAAAGASAASPATVFAPSAKSAPAAPAAAKSPVVPISAGVPSSPVAVEEVPRLLTREQFLEKVDRVFQAQTLSGVITQVIASAGSARGDTAQLAGLITRDPMLSARVLQAANSALYASAGAAVTTVPDAIRKVGFASVRNIAAALAVFDCMPEAGPDGFNPIRCWQHSFAVAQLCERLAAAELPERAGLAYMVGLCHDLGDIFIRTQFSNEYRQLLETAERTGQPWEALHGRMLGMTPTQMIGAVLKRMALPDAIREPIEIFHAPRAARTPDPLARLLWMAEHCANAALVASGPGSEVAPVTRALCRAAVGDQHPPRPDPETLRGEVLSLTVTLARLSRSDEAKLLAPMFARGEANVWVARDPLISDFDPVGAAVDALARARVHPRLPTAAEVADVDGLVVVASAANATGLTARDVEATRTLCRQLGRALPVLTVMNDAAGPDDRATVSLAELARFVELSQANRPAKAA